jgi:apolipoprotein D and lipocalin family protein
MKSISKTLTARPILLAAGAAAAITALLIAGCAVSPTPKIPPVANVDLQRFMGDWYVIGNIPTRPERNAYNAVESYSLKPDGSIDTRFRYREGGFDGELKTMNPVGTVVPGTNNAVWGMQFIWPVKAEYVIVDIDKDYQLTIVGRSSRDYAWIMARTPKIPEAAYQTAVARLKALGYSTDELRRVPQQWPEAPADTRK